MQRSHRLRRSGTAIPDSRPPTLRTPKEDHIRQGHALHFEIRIRALSALGYPPKHQHRISPSDRQSQRKNKPNTGAVLPNLLWHSAEPLAHLVTTGAVYEEFLAISDNKEGTLRLTNRIHAPHSSTNQKN